MKREIIYSAVLHLVIIAGVLFSAPFSIKKKPFDYDQVIKVRAITSQQANELVSRNTPPPPIPEPVIEDDIVDIPLDDPTKVDKQAKIDTPKPKPEKKPPAKKPNKKPTKQTESKQPTTTEGNGNDKEIDSKNTSSGSPFAGATVDNTSFDYPFWFDLAFNKIAYNWNNTVPLDGSVVCVVKFEVIKSGKIYGLSVESSSGIPAFDQTCLNAIERSNPLPPLPDEFRDEIIAITLPFKFQPR